MLISLLLIAIFCNNCGNVLQQSKFSKINFYRNIPLVSTENGTLNNILDSAAIYSYEKFIVYEQPALYTSLYNNNLVKDTIYNEYFIFDKTDTIGYWFDSLEAKKESKIVKLDSFFFYHTFLIDMKLFHINNEIKLTSDNGNDSIFIEKYIPKAKLDESYADTSIYYFSKELKNIEYSFSRVLDSIKESKVCKVRLIYNEIKNSKFLFTIPRREIWFEFRRGVIQDEASLINFINQYKKIRYSKK